MPSCLALLGLQRENNGRSARGGERFLRQSKSGTGAGFQCGYSGRELCRRGPDAHAALMVWLVPACEKSRSMYVLLLFLTIGEGNGLHGVGQLCDIRRAEVSPLENTHLN